MIGDARHRTRVALISLAAAALTLLPVTDGSHGPFPSSPVSANTAPDARPSVVLVQLDDFSMDLLQTMPSAREMRRRGAYFPHSFVVDSLCCVSRASTFTGQYPHQTRVFTNTDNLPNSVGPIGGWQAFRMYGNERRSVATTLQRSGYTTGYVGKFLNQYEIRDGVVPPAAGGWDELRVVFGAAYDGWGFASSRRDGSRLTVQEHPAPPATATVAQKDASYAGTVIHDYAIDFIERHRGSPSPYFLQVAPYAPHSRIEPNGAYPGDPIFPPAFGDRPGPGGPQGNCGAVSCSSLTTADLPGWGDRGADLRPRRKDGSLAPAWNPGRAPLSAAAAVADLRNRARMVQSADRMLTDILRTVDDDTVVILTSDNGFHLGQFGLGRGKGTPYDVDVRVPLLIVGPGIAPGKRRELVTNVDLAPTFEQLAGLRPQPYRMGRSFAGSLFDPQATRQDYAFFEHTWAPSLGEDPDVPYAGGTMDLIPSYVAVRSRTALLVRVDLDNSWSGTDYAWEFYDYSKLGYEHRNRYADPARKDQVKELRAKLAEFLSCSEVTRDAEVPKECRKLTSASASTSADGRSGSSRD